MSDKNTKKSNAWDRQEKESSQAYEAFTVYRNLGVGRTYTAVAEKLRKSSSLIRRWADNFNWHKRADEWDKTITERTLEKIVEEDAKMLEMQINIGKMMQAKGVTGLGGINFENLSVKHLSSIINLITSGVNIERSSRDLRKAQGNVKNEITINIIPRKRNEGEEARVK